MDLVELITLASIEDELSGYGSIFFWGGCGEGSWNY